MPLDHIAALIDRRRLAVLVAALLTVSAIGAGGSSSMAQDDEGKAVVVTTEVLGSVVAQLVGDAGEVAVIMPSGANPHSYDPSARDAERMLNADVLVSNGLELEEALLSVLEIASDEGVNWFEAADHVVVRDLDPKDDDDHDATDEHEHEHGLDDPHIWTDPLAMRDVVIALAPILDEAGVEVGARTDSLVAELETLDAEITEILSILPPEARALVTGHRSLGYFADRYDFDLIGTVIPSLSTAGEPTARELSQLISDIKANEVAAVFTEVGTPDSVAQAVAGDSGAELVVLTTSQLPEGGTYQDLIRDIATTIATALAP